MRGAGISIWFFIGVMLTIYGGMVLGYGLYELATHTLAPVELNDLHTPVWWGGVLLAIGVVYLIRFRPGRAAGR